MGLPERDSTTIHDPVAYCRDRAESLDPFAPPAAAAYRDAAEVFERFYGGPRIVLEPSTDQAGAVQVTWTERLWSAPADARIGRDELLEALGKSQSWLYALTSQKTKLSRRIPHRKTVDGELVFVVGEIRDWLRSREVVIVPGSIAKREVR
jgi:predicted DNA-binding transcriptional regulator AlpA